MGQSSAEAISRTRRIGSPGRNSTALMESAPVAWRHGNGQRRLATLALCRRRQRRLVPVQTQVGQVPAERSQVPDADLVVVHRGVDQAGAVGSKGGKPDLARLGQLQVNQDL